AAVELITRAATVPVRRRTQAELRPQRTHAGPRPLDVQAHGDTAAQAFAEHKGVAGTVRDGLELDLRVSAEEALVQGQVHTGAVRRRTRRGADVAGPSHANVVGGTQGVVAREIPHHHTVRAVHARDLIVVETGCGVGVCVNGRRALVDLEVRVA